MTNTSEYELAAWQNVQHFTGRALSRAVRSAGDRVAVGAAELGNRAAAYVGNRPRAQAAVSWEVLNKSVVSKVSAQFAKAFGYRLTKQGLGKVVPAVGIVIRGTSNWTTLESIVDAVNVAYRRRFLLEKYPPIGDVDVPEPLPGVNPGSGDDSDQAISVLDELAEAGGPDFRRLGLPSQKTRRWVSGCGEVGMACQEHPER